MIWFFLMIGATLATLSGVIAYWAMDWGLWMSIGTYFVVGYGSVGVMMAASMRPTDQTSMPDPIRDGHARNSKLV